MGVYRAKHSFLDIVIHLYMCVGNPQRFRGVSGKSEYLRVRLKLPQFDGHFKKYTIEVKGVSNEKNEHILQRSLN